MEAGRCPKEGTKSPCTTLAPCRPMAASLTPPGLAAPPSCSPWEGVRSSRAGDLGVATMKKGEVAKFTLAPEFAYGENGSPPKIPENADPGLRGGTD